MPVGLGKARRGVRPCPLELRAFLVANAVQRREDIFGEFPRFRQGRLGKTIAQICIDSVFTSKIGTRLMNHGEKNVSNGSAITHRGLRE